MRDPSDTTPEPSSHPDAEAESEAFTGGPRDYRFARIFSTSLMMHLLFIGALLFTPLDPLEFSEDLFRHPNRFVRQILVVSRSRPVTFVHREAQARSAAPKRAEGVFGKPVASRKLAERSRSGAPLVDRDKRERDRELLSRTGLLGALNDAEKSASSNILGPGGLGAGINLALGGMTRGAGPGDAHGVGGLGSRGLGPGGGGHTLGIGGLDTRSRTRGPGGPDGLDLEGTGRELGELPTTTTRVVGGLDKSVIAQVVRRHQSEIKYCYERELQKDPALHGKVAVLWVIDGTGAVATATVARSSMGNPEIERCILTRIRRWRFPEPRGGGVVQVTYPWIFKPSG